MKTIEQNTINSFRLAKNDIIRLQNTMIKLQNFQKDFVDKVKEIESKQVQIIYKINKSTDTKKIKNNKPKTRKIFIASKEGKKFHTTNCPFAQNIKPKKKIQFKSKVKALNEGYKPCSCIK